MIYPFKHNDVASLRRFVRLRGSGVVFVESIYSLDGSECPLADVIEICAAADCVLIVDESHCLGIRGPQGRGTVASLGAEHDVHFRTASLAKAFVGRSGLIAASAAACGMLKGTTGPVIFSSACVDHDYAGLAAALDVIAVADDRRKALSYNACYLREHLSRLGFRLAPTGSQIIPLESGDEAETVRLRHVLEAHGVFGSGFCPPATRKGESLVRLSVNAGLRADELETIVEACARVREVLDIERWPSARKPPAPSPMKTIAMPGHDMAS